MRVRVCREGRDIREIKRKKKDAFLKRRLAASCAKTFRRFAVKGKVFRIE